MIQTRVRERWYQEAHVQAAGQCNGWARNSLAAHIRKLSERIISLTNDNIELRYELERRKRILKELSK